MIRRLAIMAVIVALMVTDYAPAFLCMFAIVVLFWIWTHPNG